MEKITMSLMIEALTKIEIKAGDTLLVHSSLPDIGLWEGEIKDIPRHCKDALFEVIGDEGTLTVPAYFYEYARKGIPYDIKRSPVSKELGIFSSYIAKLPGSTRSVNPITAIAAVGKNAEYINKDTNPSSYGFDTHWDRLLNLNAKMFILGTDMRSMTFAHHVEQCMCVPYLYNKLYTTPIYDDGDLIKEHICAHVRYLDYDIEYKNRVKFDAKYSEIVEEGYKVKNTELGLGFIRVVNFRTVFDFLADEIKKNTWFLLEKKPEFVKGKIPYDSI